MYTSAFILYLCTEINFYIDNCSYMKDEMILGVVATHSVSKPGTLGEQCPAVPLDTQIQPIGTCLSSRPSAVDLRPDSATRDLTTTSSIKAFPTPVPAHSEILACPGNSTTTITASSTTAWSDKITSYAQYSEQYTNVS